MTKRKSLRREIEAEELAQWLDDDPGFSPEFAAHRKRESNRAMNTAMMFWRACPQAKCRRHRRCAHDPDYCGPIFWPVVPQDVKAWWGAIRDAKAAGRTLAQARRAADEAAAFERRRQASYKAVPRRGAEPPAPPPPAPPAVPLRDAGPRLRSL